MFSTRLVLNGNIILALLAGLGACQSPATPMPTPTFPSEPKPTTYTITVTSPTDGGQISPSSLTVIHGESATFQITVLDGYVLNDIVGCPGIMNGDQFIIESVTSNCEIDVIFSTAIPTYKTVLVEENVWEYHTSEQMPDYEYAGELHEGGLVHFFPQAPIAVDLWEDGFPDVLVPLNKGYASGIDTRFPPVLFKNDGDRFHESSDEIVGGMPAIPGLRRTVAFSNSGDGFSGVFGVAHDTGDGNAADAFLLATGAMPENITNTLPQLPLADTFGRANAVDAHAMAGGDITGNGRTDFVVGEWGDPRGPYKLIQNEPGKWQVVEDPFLYSLAHEQPMENPDAGEGHNLLIDLHLADVNGDSFDDLIVGWGHGSTYSYVYINDGQGGFSNENKKALPESIYGIDNSLHLQTYSFDANEDGYLDLLIVYSRYEPFYGGYTFQLLLNDGIGNFKDYTKTGIQSLEERDKTTFEEEFRSSEEFYFIDVNHDNMVDIIGSDWEGVRLWLHEPGPVFREVSVTTYEKHRWESIHIFVDMGNGKVSSLVFRSAQNAERTENRIWFDQADLVFEMLPIPSSAP